MKEPNARIWHKKSSFSVLSFMAFSLFVRTAAAQPVYYTENIHSIPDLTQTDERANFPGGGTEYCCLVAVANSLMWLDSNGFPELVRNSGDLFDDEVKLVKLLGSKAYMDTSLEYGTGTTKIMRGVKKYVLDCGYEIERLEYQGWRKHPQEMKSGFPVPRLSWIKQGILGKGAVWLNVGWYKYNRAKNEYTRIAGHWVTLAGYGKDENSRADPNILILHDPSPRAGKSFGNEYASVNRIRSGTLAGEWIGLPRSAAGYYTLGGGMHIKREADVAVIDGVILLELKPANAAGTKNVKQPRAGNQTSGTAASKLNPQQAKARLMQARNMLKGENKDTQQAMNILLDLAQNHALPLSSTDRCYLYVYLGYIEDLAGNREAAVGWFQKASVLEGPNIEGIRKVAQLGLRNPVTWIRHLDSGPQNSDSQPESTSGSKINVIERIGGGFVSRDKPPGELSPKLRLSKAERIENFDILWEAIDKYYSFFEHKGINWQEVKERYRPKVEAAGTTAEFYHLLYQLVRELKDFHSWLDNYKQDFTLAEFSPQLTTRLVEGKAVITDVNRNSQAYKKGIRRGSIILEVDGLSVEEKIEKLRPLIRMYSSEQAFLENVYRRLLDGDKASRVRVKFIPHGQKQAETVVLTRDQSNNKQPDEPDFRVNKGKFIWYGIHPSGLGYIRILSFNGRMEIADAYDRALEKLKDTPGLIIDIRENQGGFGTAQARIIGRLITQRTLVNIAYTKSGAGHKDFRKHETYFVPAGDWQYTKPIALLMNAVTGSACDLFACRMISTGRPVTIGTATHGNLTGQCVYVVLPCNLVVRVSNGYVCDAGGRIIEKNGNMPQIEIETTIEDIVRGNDLFIMRAVQALQKMR
jgi:C-terminal processing protease CtpA/Prc